MDNRFESLLVALDDSGAEFIVAGGVACVLHGVERVTLDLDLALSFAPESVGAFLEVMRDSSLTPRAPVDPEILTDPEARRAIVAAKHAIVFTFQDLNDPLWHVDVFLADELSYEKLVEACETVELAGRSIRLLSKSQLLALKQAIDPPRPKDTLDMGELRRLIEEEQA